MSVYHLIKLQLEAGFIKKEKQNWLSNNSGKQKKMEKTKLSECVQKKPNNSLIILLQLFPLLGGEKPGYLYF